MHYNAFKVFGKVAARLDPQPLGLSFSSLEEILQSIEDEARVERRRIFDGFVMSGTFEEIAKVRSSLQKIIPISSHQGKREPLQTDCRKSVYPKAIRESPRADKPFFEPANGQKHPDRNLTGKANLRESQGRGLNQRINMANSKETNKEEDKLVHPETLTYGSAVPLFDFPGAESSPSMEQKRESVKTELRSRGRNQYQAKATRTEDSMTTAERKRKTDEARKLEDELKKYQILGVGKRWLSREEAEKFSDLGGPQIMAQNHKRPTDLSDYKKHKVENTFLDEKNIDTRREIPIQKVANKEICELSQGKTTESSAIKKSFVEDDPNERTENTELVMVTTSDDASGSTSEPAPFPYGTELRSNNQNQDETKPFETLSRKQQGGNNNGLRGVKEKGNSPLDSGGEAVRSDHIEENDMDETQRNEICEKQVQPQSKNPKSPNESIKELESTISRRESNHIKFSTETGITVMLLEGDITNHHADLLIRPTNPSICHKERLSNQFQDRGGTLLKDECQRSTKGQETPNYGEVYFTDSGNLPCKAILHAILPLWTEEKKDTKDLKHLIHVCLKKGLILASEHGHRSVALPPLGQEGNPIPVRVSAQVTTRVIASFSRSVTPLHNGVTDLHVVCNDDATVNVFAKQLREFSFRDKQRPYFVQAEDKTVPYQSIGRCGTERKTVELSSLKGTPRQENQNTIMLPVSKTDLASQPASLSDGTESRRNNLIRNETKPCKALPKNQQDDDGNSRLKNVKEEENAFLENGGEAVTNHPKDETMFTEALKQSEICGEEAHQQPKSPNSDESIEDAESSTIVMGNNHVKFSAETGMKDVNENVKRDTKETSGLFRELAKQRENDRQRIRDEELREMTQHLKNVRRQLQERDGQLREMGNQLTDIRRQLQERDGQLTEKDRQLREKDEQLREKTQQLTNTEGQLKEKDKQLREKTQQVTNTEGQLKEKDKQLREKTQQMTNTEGQLQEKDKQLREKTQQLANTQGQLQEKDGELKEKTQQLANTQGQLQEKDEELKEKTQHLKNAEEQLQEKDEEVSSLENRLEEKEQQVDELEDSLSAISQALNKLSRQQSPDWVIPRDQIQLTEKCLGRGGWGIVVKGKYCGCTVAVKQIYDDLLKSSSYYWELFEREMNIASRCRHPCLLQFIGATNDEGTPLFVTELMETSLRALSEQRSLSPTEVSVISLDVARALNYLHLKKPSPIIHRDISSANVLLWREADQWRGKVSDYGTANFKRDIMTACPGSRIYSAPEALTESQTAKVDVYSFGVLLCEICTRKLPDPDRRDEQVAMVKNRTLRALIRRCLKRAPEARPSMEDIIGELEQSMLD